MSFKAFVWAWDQDVPNPDYHHVLLALANIAPVREVKASVPYIAGQVRRSPRKVRSALEWLETAEIVTITERPGKVDVIRLNIPAEFSVLMEDDADLEAGTRGRPRKPLHPAETPAPETAKPLANPSTRGADEPREPDEPREAVASLPTVPVGPDATRAFGRFNDLATAHGWSQALKLTDQRRRALNARIGEAGGIECFVRILDDIENSPFLMGRTSARFSISLDFLLQPSSFVKLMEGFYHRDRTANVAGGGRAADHADGVASMLAGARAALDRRQRQ